MPLNFVWLEDGNVVALPTYRPPNLLTPLSERSSQLMKAADFFYLDALTRCLFHRDLQLVLVNYLPTHRNII